MLDNIRGYYERVRLCKITIVLDKRVEAPNKVGKAVECTLRGGHRTEVQGHVAPSGWEG